MRKLSILLVVAAVYLVAAHTGVAATQAGLKITVPQEMAYAKGLKAGGATSVRCQFLNRTHRTMVCVFREQGVQFGVAVTRPTTCRLHQVIYLVAKKAVALRTINTNLCGTSV
jgi:hypothetical protein